MGVAGCGGGSRKTARVFASQFSSCGEKEKVRCGSEWAKENERARLWASS
jgi:hypothetical protein